jgi:serine/threonine protein kinase
MVTQVTQEVEFPAKASPEFRVFIKRMLEKNPENRPSAKELLEMKFIQRYSDLEVCEELCRKQVNKFI